MTTETKTTHTPGPWYVDPEDLHGVRSDLLGGTICTCFYEPHELEWFMEISRANARLIAAAPDLLEACRLAAKHWEDTDAPIGKVLRDAIAKAEEGEATDD